MGTYECALSALNTNGRIPFGHLFGNGALFKLGRRRREGTVGGQFAYRQFVALLNGHNAQNFTYERIGRIGHCGLHVNIAFGVCRIIHFFDGGQSHVDGCDVLLNDVGAFFTVGFFDEFFHIIYGFGFGQNARNLKIRGLHDDVYARAHSGFFRNLKRVDNVKVHLFVENGLLLLDGNVRPYGFRIVGTVQQKGRAFFRRFEHVICFHIGELMTSDKVGARNQIRAADGFFAETQVRYGKTAGLFGVVRKIRLSVHFGAGVSDDFNRVFVRADRTVGAQTVEHGFVRAFFFKRPRSVVRKAFAQNVVVDADDKVVLFFAVEIFEYAFYHCGRKFFRAQTVAAADDGIDFASEFGKSGLYVFIQGFAQRTGFFCAVEHGQSLN